MHGRFCQCCPFHLHRRETMNNEKTERVIHHFTFEFVFTEFIDKNTITACKRSLRRLYFHRCLSVHGGGWHEWWGWHAWQGSIHGRGVVWQGHVLQGVCMAGRGGLRGRRDSHCSGLYASYWNVFLYLKKII